MFMRMGTPSGLRMMSTGVPSGRKGMSSCGRILATTPLLPWRPAILSPTLILRLAATLTRISRLTPGSSSSPRVAAELADVDDLAALAVGQAQAGVLNLARLLTEDRAQQALLGGQLGLALGRDLADQDVARLDLGADVDDAVLVEVLERLLADVGDVAGDLLGTELGVARLDLVLLDVDAGEQVLAHEAVADDDGVLVVAALPAHEGDQDVAAEGQLAAVGRAAVGDRLADLDAVADLDDRALVDARALVGADELLERVAVELAGVVLDLDALGGDAGHDAAARRRRRPGRSRARRAPPCRCRRWAPPARAAARPGAACSSPSARGWRRRARGTG